MSEVGEFNLIIEKVDASSLAQASGEFARAFGLDEQLTQQLLKTSPILFATKLTKHEVKALTPKLADLSKYGFEFRITSKTAKVPKVNWLMRPNFTAADSGSHGVAFDWQNQAFVCPGCGETFVYSRVGKLPLSEPAVTPAAEADKSITAKQVRVQVAPPLSFEPRKPAPAPAKSITVAKPAAAPKPKAPEPVKVKVADETLDELDLGLAEERKAPTPTPTPVKATTAKSKESFTLKAPDETQADEEFSLDLDASKPSNPAASSSTLNLEEIDLAIEQEEAPPPAPKTVTAKQPAAAPKVQVTQPKPQAAPEPLNVDLDVPKTDTPKPVPEGDVYNVFVPEVKDKVKQEEVVKLITNIRGCSADEARKLTRRLMIPVAKNVGKDEAEDILSKFKKLKITGRMTKVAKGEAE